jgi:hypothetical protein
MSNTSGKICKITATSISNPAGDVNAIAKQTQMTELNSSNQLMSTTKYKSTLVGSSVSGGISTVMQEVNQSGQSTGQITLQKSDSSKFIQYSTRFTMECGTPLATDATSPDTDNLLTYSKKSVDMLSACTGQN